ncbi:hypothetical protein BdWA1_001613 [Babesia duncani]|uniref:t-SNARE coiled-coil homology domain-containing protein n=1 Tax=Babesia duncani TaxID=323732 RepID=A0AAD9PK57_9APIC|nr:hypothetical protein BdWA1_003588 [Babesia duncani]KAK2196370.1 hypothetical protein BdWA1_001613 [Babesia duncani]
MSSTVGFLEDTHLKNVTNGKQNLETADFEAQKVLVLNILTDITSGIRERSRLKHEKAAHPLAHVRLATKLDSLSRSARTELDTLEDILSKINGSKRLKKQYTEADIQNFKSTLGNLQEQFTTCEATIRQTLIDSPRKQRVNLDLTEPQNLKAATKEEELMATDSIRKWRQRDEEFDQQLQEIGEAVDRIGMVAAQIGERANVQAELAIETIGQVEGTTLEISSVTHKIKKLIKRQRRIECTIRIALIGTMLLLLAIFIYAFFSFIKSL